MPSSPYKANDAPCAWRTGLWRNGDFVKLWVGQTVSLFGSGITGEALPFAAFLVLGATSAELGLLAAAGSLPVLVVGLLAGVWVDRLRRRPILIASDLARALVLLTIPAAYLFGWLSLGQLFVVAALVGTLNIFFEVAYHSYMPSLIGREHLVEGNSKLSASGSIAEIAGPSAAGVLVQLLTAPFAILIDALSFIFSATALALIRKPEPPPEPGEEGSTVWRDIGEGLSLVVKHRTLRALAASSASFNFVGNFFVLYGFYAVTELGIPPAVVGVLIGLGGVGALLGALVTKRVTGRFGTGRALAWSLVVTALLGVLTPLAGGPVWLSTLMLGTSQIVGDIAIAIYLINELSLRQSVIPDRLLGRANASIGFLVGAVGPAGALLGGALGELIGPRLTLGIAVAGIALSSLWLFFSPVYNMRADARAEEQTYA